MINKMSQNQRKYRKFMNITSVIFIKKLITLVLI